MGSETINHQKMYHHLKINHKTEQQLGEATNGYLQHSSDGLRNVTLSKDDSRSVDARSNRREIQEDKSQICKKQQNY